MLIDVRQIGNRIREARVRAGLSQPQLSRLAEVANATVSRWETGKTVPTLNSLYRLAEALDVPVGSLVYRRPLAAAEADLQSGCQQPRSPSIVDLERSWGACLRPD